MDVIIDSAHPFESEIVLGDKLIVFCDADIHLKHVSPRLSTLKRFDCVLWKTSRVTPVTDVDDYFLRKGCFEERGGV